MAKWRQCVTAAGLSAVGAGFEYMAVGALRAGGELREVRMLIVATGSATSEYYLAISGTGEAGAVAFGAASPLMQGPTTYRHLGKPGWAAGVYSYWSTTVVFPMAVFVESGSRWVHVAWRQHATRGISVVVTATVEGGVG